jgi:hypothetical protein
MKKVLASVVVILLAGFAQPSSVLHASSAATVTAGAVKVTVHYKGKGKVDGSHKIWVWLFDTPNIGAGSMPIDQTSIDKNGSEVVFEGVAPSQVYIAVAFDESGSMMGDAPPPTGTPIGILMGANGTPNAVAPGEKGPVVMTFDDSMRMP